MSWRKKALGGNSWGAFSDPVVWSHWGENGMDGDGVQYVYKLFDHELSDAERTSNIPTKPASMTDGEWIPTGWSDDPLAPTESMPFCYCSVIKCIGGTWGNFEKLGLWSKYGKDGEPGAGQPDYIQTQEAWSSAESVASITTMPSDCTESSWSDTTPANSNNKPYLWRRSRKMVLQSDGTYAVATGLDGQWKYARITGTNGTSITVKGTVATVADLANISNPQDGDAYVVSADGHLYVWSTEANDWIDVGQFKGDPGTTYYTHVAWASGVTLGTPPSHTPSQGQISTPNAASVTTFDVVPFTGATHMGVLIDTTSQDSTEKYCYTWQEVKGAQGDPGEDSISVLVSPPSMVIEQDINNTDNIAPSATNVLGDFSIQVFKGTTSCSMTQVTASSNGGKILISYSTTSGYSQNVFWNPQGTTAHLYVKGIAKDSSDNYYDNGTISLTITYTDPDTYTSKTVSNVSANVYVNLIGTWKTTIEGDVQTEVAAKTTYTVDGTNYTVSQDLGTFVKSSTENTSTISRKVDDGKNLFRGTLTATGW